MKLTEEAVMHIHGRIEVGKALVMASGASKEFAPFACDPLSCLVLEPHAETATTRTILRSTMGIDFHTHHAKGISFFFRELIDFSFQLIGLFAIEPP